MDILVKMKLDFISVILLFFKLFTNWSCWKAGAKSLFAMSRTEKSKRKSFISKLTVAANKAVNKSKGGFRKLKTNSVRPLNQLPNHLRHLDTELQAVKLTD